MPDLSKADLEKFIKRSGVDSFVTFAGVKRLTGKKGQLFPNDQIKKDTGMDDGEGVMIKNHPYENVWTFSLNGLVFSVRKDVLKEIFKRLE